MIPVEFLIVLLAIALYLYDSLVFLQKDNQVLLCWTFTGWKVRLVANEFRLVGNRVYLPNPLAPHCWLIRVAWDIPSSHATSSQTGTNEARLSYFAKTKFLQLPQIVSLIQSIILFILMPMIAFFFGFGLQFLVLVAEIYMLCVVSLVWVFLCRKRLGLSLNRACLLALDSLVCIPNSLNIPRKLSLQASVSGDVVDVCSYLMENSDREQIFQEMQVAIDRELQITEPGSPRYADLTDYRTTLVGNTK